MFSLFWVKVFFYSNIQLFLTSDDESEMGDDDDDGDDEDEDAENGEQQTEPQ